MIKNERVLAFIESNFEHNIKNQASYLDKENFDEYKLFVSDIKERILSGKELPASFWQHLKDYYALSHLIYSLLTTTDSSNEVLSGKEERFWYLKEPFLKNLLDLDTFNKTHTSNVYVYLCHIIFNNFSIIPFNEAKSEIQAIGFTDELILEILTHLNSYNLQFYKHSTEETKELSFIGHFLLSNKKKSKLAIFSKSNDNFLKEFLQKRNKSLGNLGRSFLQFLLDNEPDFILEFYNDLFIGEPYHGSTKFRLEDSNLEYLKENNYKDYNRLIELLQPEKNISNRDKLTLFRHLENPSPSQKQFIRETIINYFDEAKKIDNSWSIEDRLGDYQNNTSVYSFSLKFYKAYFPSELHDLIHVMVDEMQVLSKKLINALIEEFGIDGIPDVVRYINRKAALKFEDVIIHGLQCISQNDSWNHRSVYYEIGISTSNKRILQEITDCFVNLGDRIIDELKALLNTNSSSNRFLGAFVLSKFKNEELKKFLLSFVDAEKNDDTRDTLIETLKEELYPEHFNFEDLQTLIEKADRRKKISGIKEKGIESSELPALFWNTGEQLNEKELAFLFYRNARSKGINSDIEARLVTRFIDKEKSAEFSKYILKNFIDQGAQAKQKHLMMLAAILGNDTSVNLFESLFKRMIDEKRVKIAEMVIHNTMIIGTNKALRLVEFISRKYANKKPALAEAARNALSVAAKELNITADELADRIIPNFDFEDLQRTISIDEEEYRMMIDFDFSLVFFDENNKKRKSLPKTAPKELKDEMNAIAKDLKAIVRMQSGRMEQFFVSGKKWAANYWIDLFMNHPILFVYATKLIWIAERKNGTKEVFRVLEDVLMVSIEDDEIETDDLENIYLYHPIQVDENTNNLWKNFCYEKEISTLFEQVNRKVYNFEITDFEKGNYSKFPSKEIPKGAEFVKSSLEKRGWIKETSDGGSINFYKQFPELDLTVQPWINGPYAFYMEGQTAEIESIEFMHISNRKKHNLEGVPQILLSEILHDMYHLIETN